ncbi:MAG: outer membrane beta-barrel protein [Candidatus Omnitrophica bacterium]|nr:outer membrane beta-barrel protein [Candidatus Omnitrophota bacterium]
MKKVKYLSFSLMFLSLFLVSGNLWADELPMLAAAETVQPAMSSDIAAPVVQPPQEIARLRIKPTFKYSAALTSNPTLANTSANDNKYRLTQNIAPGFIAQIPLDRAYAEIGYEYGYYKVAGFKGKGISETNSLGFEDNYTTAATDFTADKKYEMNVATASLKKQFGNRLSSGLDYSFTKFNGPSGTQDSDYDENAGVWKSDFRLSPVTTLNPSFTYRAREFTYDSLVKDKKNYNAYEFTLGISQQLLKRLTASLNGGYTQRSYKAGGDEKVATYGAGLAARLTNFSNLRMDYQHSVQDTFYGLDQETTTVFANSPFLNNENIATLIDSEYRSIIADRITSNLNLRLTDKDIVDIGFLYLWSNSSSSNGVNASTVNDGNLKEETYSVGLGYSHYITKWVSLGVNSAYGSRRSKTRGNYDYKSFGGAINLNVSF